MLGYVQNCQELRLETGISCNSITGGGVGTEARLELAEGSAGEEVELTGPEERRDGTL